MIAGRLHRRSSFYSEIRNRRLGFVAGNHDPLLYPSRKGWLRVRAALQILILVMAIRIKRKKSFLIGSDHKKGPYGKTRKGLCQTTRSRQPTGAYFASSSLWAHEVPLRTSVLHGQRTGHRETPSLVWPMTRRSIYRYQETEHTLLQKNNEADTPENELSFVLTLTCSIFITPSSSCHISCH